MRPPDASAAAAHVGDHVAVMHPYNVVAAQKVTAGLAAAVAQVQL